MNKCLKYVSFSLEFKSVENLSFRNKTLDIKKCFEIILNYSFDWLIAKIFRCDAEYY